MVMVMVVTVIIVMTGEEIAGRVEATGEEAEEEINECGMNEQISHSQSSNYTRCYNLRDQNTGRRRKDVFVK